MENLEFVEVEDEVVGLHSSEQVLTLAVLQIPVRASRHGPLADYFQQTGPVLVREAPKKWAFLE